MIKKKEGRKERKKEGSIANKYEFVTATAVTATAVTATAVAKNSILISAAINVFSIMRLRGDWLFPERVWQSVNSAYGGYYRKAKAQVELSKPIKILLLLLQG